MKLAGALSTIAEAVWCGVFAAAGHVLRVQISRWKPSGGQRILVIAPHPDDEALGCAGTVLLHARAGDAVCLAYVTDGSKSRALGLNQEQMSRQRKLEAQAAARLLQASRIEWFGLPEGNWTLEQGCTPLAALLRQFSPQVIYAPSCVDFHPEHHRVAHALALAISLGGKESSEATLRVYQLQVPLTPFLTNLVTDCSSVSDESATAMSVYVSQEANLGRALRLRRYAANYYGFEKHGEELWQMTAADYCHIHGSPPETWRTSSFRGIRYRSLSDPLAYLLGLNERIRLKREAAAESPASSRELHA